jgi:hypothetical protein
MGGSGDASRAQRRIARTRDAICGLGDQMSRWFAAHGEDLRFSRFANHLVVLRAVLDRMVDSLMAAVAELPADVNADTAYHRCRAIDRGVVAVQRTFDWYAEKYDQRLDPESEKVLLAADEVVRSCWTQPFAALHAIPPTGPLPYLDNRFDAFATLRVSVPPDLRAPADAIVAGYIGELPIPTIALPGWAAHEAWWLVLAAHETGHVVQSDLCNGLEAATRQALTTAVAAAGKSGKSGDSGDSGDAAELASFWSGWALEAFADAYSVLMVGDSAAWAIDELQHGTPADLVTACEPGDRYPPPCVRLALLGELCHLAGVGSTWPRAADVAAWLDGLDAAAAPAGARTQARRHLAVTQAAAAGLLGLPVGDSTLRGVSGLKPDWFGDSGRVRRWSQDMGRPSASFGPVSDRPAARHGIAAGVLAWAWGPEGDRAADVIHGNLVGLLPTCGEPGVLAQPPEPSAVDAVASKLAARLLDDIAKDATKDTAP